MDFRQELKLHDDVIVRVWPVPTRSPSTFVLLADIVRADNRSRVSAAHAVITCVRRGQGKVPMGEQIGALLADGAEQCRALSEEVFAESFPELTPEDMK